jgi:proteasome lid subunit RPN8/RPN11
MKRRRISGKPASVEADWEWTLKREEKRGDVIGFAHTHPSGAGTTPSERDIRTLRAWRIALGKPLLMLIQDGTLTAGYVLHSDDDELKSVTSIARDERGALIIDE